MKALTTHILDLMSGKPAANVKVELFYQTSSNEMQHIATRITNDDGRLDEAFLEQGALKKGNYQYVFFIGDYFRRKAVDLPDDFADFNIDPADIPELIAVVQNDPSGQTYRMPVEVIEQVCQEVIGTKVSV